jgi:hypothetical protein
MPGNGNAAYLTSLPVVLSSHLIFIDHFAISMKYKYHLAKFNFKKTFKLCNFTLREARLHIDRKITIGISQPTHGNRGSLSKDFAHHFAFSLKYRAIITSHFKTIMSEPI